MPSYVNGILLGLGLITAVIIARYVFHVSI
jgi:hypothetical protein